MSYPRTSPQQSLGFQSAIVASIVLSVVSFLTTWSGLRSVDALKPAEGADGFTSDDATLSLTFTSSEATTFFALEDITVTNGALSSFSATSTTVYTATFTPTSDGAVTIDVAADTFSDALNNNNTAADQFNWTYDTTGPTMTITAAEGIDGFTSGDATLSLTFTASEVTNNFAADDVTVTNGVISDFSVSSGSSGETFLNFDGTDDYVIIENPSPAAPSINTSRSAFAWIKPSAYGGNVFSWGKREGNKRWSILLNSGGFGLIGESNDVWSSGAVTLNSWAYVGATYDGDSLKPTVWDTLKKRDNTLALESRLSSDGEALEVPRYHT